MLTLIGNAFVDRVAASLLTAVGLPELITETQPAYESLAIQPGVDRRRLASIRDKLVRNRLATQQFDTASFARHIESAYGAMHERARAGLPPADIDIGV